MSIHGREISSDIGQINVKVVEAGAKPVEELLGAGSKGREEITGPFGRHAACPQFLHCSGFFVIRLLAWAVFRQFANYAQSGRNLGTHHRFHLIGA